MINKKTSSYPKYCHLYFCESQFLEVRQKIQGVWNVVRIQDSYFLSLKRDESVLYQVDSVFGIVSLLECSMGHLWMVKHKLMEAKK
jgi:hypothetical protein